MWSDRVLAQFIAVAEELHFGRAAERLHMQQSPLSQAILRLEHQLGVQLLRRDRRSVQLTEAGRIFLDDARMLLEQGEAAVRRSQAVAAGALGSLRIGFVASTAQRVLPDLLRRYAIQHPKVELHLADLTLLEQMERVRSRTLDAGLVRLPAPPQSDDIRHAPIGRFPLAVALPAHHPLAEHSVLRLADLAEIPFSAPDPRRVPWLAEQLNQACRAAGFEPTLRGRVNSVAGMLALTAAGSAAALVPEYTVPADHPTIRLIPLIGDPLPVTEIALVWRHDNHNPALAGLLTLTLERHR